MTVTASTQNDLAAGLTRLDGPAKLTGAAHYAADQPVPAGTLHAVLVTATVPSGRIAELDTAEAGGAPGVHRVLRPGDLPPLAAVDRTTELPLGHALIPMLDDRVRYEGQVIGIVLAGSAEQARYAAGLVRVRYQAVEPLEVFAEAPDEVPEGRSVIGEPDESVGDVAAGLAAAEVRVRAEYATADRHHSPIEPSATLAEWDGDTLTVHTSVQAVGVVQFVVSALFGMPAEQVRVICPFIGGGFGCKGFFWSHTLLAIAAARVVGRPVKLVLTRAQMFTQCGHQPATSQTVELGATRSGLLTAVVHHSANPCAWADDYVEMATHPATWMYASPAIEARVRVRHLHRSAPTPMRAPHEGPGMVALESAMDELAVALDLDPVELRLRNEPSVDPLTGRPFSTRKLVECLREGAARFGWAERGPVGSMREGNDLVGWGVAAASMDTYRGPSSARLRVDADGHVTVFAGFQEIGTGLPGMVATVVAETLGCPAADVTVHNGDSSYPAHGGTFGSMSTMSLGSAVRAAATEVSAKLGSLRGRTLAEALAEAGLTELETEGRWAPEEDALSAGRSARFSMHTYGAVFAEVRVDRDLGLVRMPRVVGVYAAGRILNPLAAHSQLTGGIIWGYGQAVLERSPVDPGLGRFLNKNLAGYVVPVNADIGSIDASFVADDDRHANPLGAKGIGELGAVGVGPAVANAVYHATGRRIRTLPIRIHDLL